MVAGERHRCDGLSGAPIFLGPESDDGLAVTARRLGGEIPPPVATEADRVVSPGASRECSPDFYARCNGV